MMRRGILLALLLTNCSTAHPADPADGGAGGAPNGEGAGGGGGAAGTGTGASNAAGGSATTDCGVLTMSAKLSTPEGDYFPESAKPTGSCSAWDACVLFSIQQCPCGTYGALTMWDCACSAGSWSCTLKDHGATACVCPADGGT